MEPEVLSSPTPTRPVTEIAALFWNCELPHTEWTHAAHLAVALDAIARWGRDEALTRLREGIARYNEANGVANSLTSGYHETLTRFFVGAVADFYRQHPDESLEALYPRLLEIWGDKNCVFVYYSRRHVFSPYARMDWRAPDLHPLPFEV